MLSCKKKEEKTWSGPHRPPIAGQEHSEDNVVANKEHNLCKNNSINVAFLLAKTHGNLEWVSDDILACFCKEFKLKIKP